MLSGFTILNKLLDESLSLNKTRIFNIYANLIKRLSRGHGLGKIYPIKILLKKTKTYLKPEFVIIQGNKIYLDEKDSLDLSLNKTYGELDTKTVTREIKNGDVVIDIGAHIGYYTLLFAKMVGETGKVFAFEPEPKNFELLKKNIEINGYHNIILEQKAVSDTNGFCILYIGQKSSGANRIYEPKKTRTQQFKPIQVETIKLDDYFKSHNVEKINFIKMDVEGAEFHVLQGMRSILRKNRELTIFTEFDRIALEDSGVDPKKMLELFDEEGFTVYYVNEEKNMIEDADKEELLTSDYYLNKTINLLCKK